MDAIGALFLIAVGVGILAVARHGRLTGELPAGSNFLRGPWRPNREDNPVAFRAFLAAERLRWRDIIARTGLRLEG